MDNLVQMSTTGRHNKLISTLIGTIFDLIKKKKIIVGHEQYSIVHWGSRKKNASKFICDVGNNGILANGTRFKYNKMFDRDDKITGSIFDEYFKNAKRLGI